ncbi:MAG: hypothetical protein GQ583_12365 [Methyloprofundus sp.]|nr:hypothetical protein [Methyloprofundus sp.]
MFTLLRVILYGIGILAVIIVTIIALSTSNKTLHIPKWTLSNIDIQRAKNILHANQQATGKFVSLELTERDLNVACTYLLNLYTESQSDIQIKRHYIAFNFLFTLPENLFGHYIPIRFQLHLPLHQPPEIKNLYIGKLAIPDIYAGLLIGSAIKHSRLKQYLELISKNIKVIQLQSQQLHIKYQRSVNTTVAHATQSSQKQPSVNTDNHALEQYQAQLDKALSHHDPAWLLSLSDVLQPLFQLAQQRSTPASAITENRLAIFVANRYVNHASDSHNKQSVPRYLAYLYKRPDMAQHFMWSATLSSLGGSQLALMIGVEKELNDAKTGSGFSFIDLAADRAGIRFGEQATTNPRQAMKIQQQMANIKNYQAFMPNVKDLPERLSSEAFKSQYKSVDSQKYQAILQEIDRRIAASQIYRLAEK